MYVRLLVYLPVCLNVCPTTSLSTSLLIYHNISGRFIKLDLVAMLLCQIKQSVCDTACQMPHPPTNTTDVMTLFLASYIKS